MICGALGSASEKYEKGRHQPPFYHLRSIHLTRGTMKYIATNTAKKHVATNPQIAVKTSPFISAYTEAHASITMAAIVTIALKMFTSDPPSIPLRFGQYN